MFPLLQNVLLYATAQVLHTGLKTACIEKIIKSECLSILMTFWIKEKHPTKEVTVHYCSKHDFRSYNPLEIEEHERIHELEDV